MDRATTALLLYLVWFAVAFVVRAVVQIRRTGDSGFRIGVERPGSFAWWARIGFVVSMLVGLAAPVADLAGLMEAIDGLATTATASAGIALVAVGVATTFVAQVVMGESWRVGVDPEERTALVVRGPFRLVRNPIFTTMAVTAAGFTLLVPSVVAIAGFVALLVSLEVQVRAVEEPYLRRAHGEAYRRYCAEVGRFVPKVGRAASA